MAKNASTTHTSMRGKVIDMELLRKKNELTPAIGNARVNARGDELGPGGKIVRKREEIIKEYYEKNPNAVIVDTGIKKPAADTVQEPNVETATVETKTSTRKSSKPSAEETKQFEEFDEGWEEDADGNFTKKGDK
jgi:hypothetical protein